MSAVEQIEAAHARNLAVQRSRLASMPEVGIFWLIDNKLVADSIPFPQADVYGGFYGGKNGHAALWTTLHRLVPQWRGKEYTDFPRGLSRAVVAPNVALKDSCRMSHWPQEL
jgi:hypothetical protein